MMILKSQAFDFRVGKQFPRQVLQSDLASQFFTARYPPY
jgi:hypothetical protein